MTARVNKPTAQAQAQAPPPRPPRLLSPPPAPQRPSRVAAALAAPRETAPHASPAAHAGPAPHTGPAPHADAIVAAVSRKIAVLRRARRLSLDQLAARSTVSKGMLVQIEQGRANPSIQTLCKVAGALGASVAELVEVGGGAPVHVITAAAPRTLWTGPAGGSATLLVGSNGPDMLELWTWHLEPGERYDAPAHPDGTQELVHVSHGALSLEVEGVGYIIGAGQSAFARTDRVHAYACAGRRAARFTMVVAEWHPSRRRRAPRSARA